MLRSCSGSLVECFATSLLAVKQRVSQWWKGEKKNLAKRKLECHVESGIRFDVERDVRSRRLGESTHMKLNQSRNDFI